jgi:hypothetical protein
MPQYLRKRQRNTANCPPVYPINTGIFNSVFITKASTKIGSTTRACLFPTRENRTSSNVLAVRAFTGREQLDAVVRFSVLTEARAHGILGG